ncbi:MAG: acetyl-CoA carboxylase biotin carboxyl carrier protein [Candidatus Limnocylindrales bacterium]
MPTSAPGPDPITAETGEALRTQRDHEAIARLADEFLPALIAKLASTGLGEIEVRQGGWKARLRKPAAAHDGRPSIARASEVLAAAGHAAGRSPVPARPEERDRRSRPEEEPAAASSRVAAKSPAVGVYHPRRDLVVGMRVRAGDKIGTVDVLGVKQDVVAPVDGVVGSSLAEAGDAVEYGQELVRIDLLERASGDEAGRLARETGAIPGRP